MQKMTQKMVNPLKRSMMNKPKYKRFYCFTGALLMVLSALIASTESYAFAEKANHVKSSKPQDCVAISDSNQRLACFDSFFVEKLSVEKEVVASAVPSVSEATVSAPVEQVKSIPSEEEVISKFGSLTPEKKVSDELESIALTVSKVVLTQRKRQVFYFTNGQVWENRTNKALRIKEGDTGIIKRGALSAFYLSKEGVRGRVRVKRKE